MKNGKRPTLKQKKMIISRGLNIEKWLVVKDTTECIEIVNRDSGKLRRLYKSC